jgi:hypothetical protein
MLSPLALDVQTQMMVMVSKACEILSRDRKRATQLPWKIYLPSFQPIP